MDWEVAKMMRKGQDEAILQTELWGVSNVLISRDLNLNNVSESGLVTVLMHEQRLIDCNAIGASVCFSPITEYYLKFPKQYYLKL